MSEIKWYKNSKKLSANFKRNRTVLSITMHCCLRYTVQAKKIDKIFLETDNKINNVNVRNVPKRSLTLLSAFKNGKSTIALNVVYQHMVCVVSLEVCSTWPVRTQDTNSYVICAPVRQGWKYRLEIDNLYFFFIECKNSLLFFSLSIEAFPYFFAW